MDNTTRLSMIDHPGLMWIVLLGRCCLHWADMIAGAYAAGCSSTSSGASIAELQTAGSANSTELLTTLTTCIPLRLVVVKVQGLLSPDSSMARQLSEYDYLVAPVIDSAAAALAAWDAFLQSPDSVTNAALPGLASAVRALGEALTSMAAPYCCNNPGCLNISGPSDVALVSGKSCICGKCKVARYCDKACQQQHWRLHKPVCKALAAAQQVAGSATTSTAEVTHLMMMVRKPSTAAATSTSTCIH